MHGSLVSLEELKTLIDFPKLTDYLKDVINEAKEIRLLESTENLSRVRVSLKTHENKTLILVFHNSKKKTKRFK